TVRVLRLPDLQPVAQAALSGRPHHPRACPGFVGLPRGAQAGPEGDLPGHEVGGLLLLELLILELLNRPEPPDYNPGMTLGLLAGNSSVRFAALDGRTLCDV